MNINFKINLTNSQKEALSLVDDPGVLVLTLAWSRQSGKSTLMKVITVRWLLSERGSRTAYVCRTYMLAKRFFTDIMDALRGVEGITSNSSDLVIRHSNGSSIQFFSAESGHAIRGYSFNYLILDEFAFFPATLPDGANLYFDVLSPTMKVSGRKTIMVSTPNGRANLFHEMFERGINGEKGYASLRKTIYDDGLVRADEVERIRNSIPALTWRQEYLVEFLDGGMSVFKGFEKCFSADVFDYSLPCWGGVDFSSRGQDRTVVTLINSEGDVIQRQVDGPLDSRYVQIAGILDGVPNMVRCLMESNSIGMPMSNEVSKLVSPRIRHRLGLFTTTSKSKEEIVGALAVAIANEGLHFMRDDDVLYSELSSFGVTYTKAGRMQYQALSGHDDRVMSLAIALKAKEKVISPISKNLVTIRQLNDIIE